MIIAFYTQFNLPLGDNKLMYDNILGTYFHDGTSW